MFVSKTGSEEESMKKLASELNVSKIYGVYFLQGKGNFMSKEDQ